MKASAAAAQITGPDSLIAAAATLDECGTGGSLGTFKIGQLPVDAERALLEAGDTVLGLSLDHGGHLTHGSPVNISGRFYDFVSYGLTPSDERLDLDQLRDLARTHRPKMIVAGATAYPRIIDPAPIREICDEVGALFLFDAAHIAGLVAGGAHPNPVPYADVVTFTTHKTLRGPRGGCIVSRAEHAAAMVKAMSRTVSAKIWTRSASVSGTSASIVAGTEPSSELSTGTQPMSAAPERTDSMTATGLPSDSHETSPAATPANGPAPVSTKRLAAISVKVPAGPK